MKWNSVIIRINLAFFLTGCSFFMPDEGHLGQPCTKGGVCIDGSECINKQCINSNVADEDEETDFDNDTENRDEVTNDEDVIFCDPDPCDHSLHFQCDETADECVCDYTSLPDGEGNCVPKCESDTNCVEQNRECLIHDGTSGTLGEIYCGSCLAAGYHLEGNECVADTSCLVNSCSQHGECDLIDGVGLICSCDFGYVGDHCESCDAENNFVWDDDEEECKMRD